MTRLLAMPSGTGNEQPRAAATAASDVATLIRSDLHRLAGRTDARTLLRRLLFDRSFKYCFWLRCSGSASAPLRIVGKVMHRHLSHKYGIQIPSRTRIGPGFFIGHHMGVVINETAVIGRNCNIGQFTTIGSNHENAARIGDNVYIGPSVSIVEGVSIGNGATIGAGSVVVKDVPAGATVAGNPARVVSRKAPGRYIQNPWPAHSSHSDEGQFDAADNVVQGPADAGAPTFEPDGLKA